VVTVRGNILPTSFFFSSKETAHEHEMPMIDQLICVSAGGGDTICPGILTPFRTIKGRRLELSMLDLCIFRRHQGNSVR